MPKLKVCDDQHCDDHTGMVERDNNALAWIKATFSLMAVSAGLLSYSVFWQAPNIKADVAREIARLDKMDQACDFRLKDVEKDVKILDRRVSELEAR